MDPDPQLNFQGLPGSNLHFSRCFFRAAQARKLCKTRQAGVGLNVKFRDED